VTDTTDLLADLRHQITVHPGRIAWIEWDALSASLGVFRGNAAKLRSMLLDAAKPPLALQLVQNPPPGWRQELQRRLHNYVAATKTLVDHTRRLLALYPDTNLAVEYEPRKNTIATAPVTAFFNDLRNYVLHHRLPFPGHQLSMTGPAAAEQSFESKVLLSTSGLLEWDNWSATSRSFLEAQKGDVDLLLAMNEHRALVEQLYNWLLRQFPVLHGDDLDDVNRLIRDYNARRPRRPNSTGPGLNSL